MATRQAAVLAVADDLTGAAEVAGFLNLRTTRIQLIHPAEPDWPTVPEDIELMVLDLGSRSLSPEVASGLLTRSISACGAGRVVFLKIDSMLRGNVDAVVAAAAATGSPVLVAPTAPHTGRHVTAGVITVNGRPLSDAAAWELEPTPAPTSITAALPSAPTATVPLEVIRSGNDPLREHLRRVFQDGAVAVCDAVTETDLDGIVVAASTAAPLAAAPILIGSGGLAAALGRYLSDGGQAARPTPRSAAQTALVVVGTAEPAALQQVQRLVSHGVSLISIDADTLLTAPGDAASTSRADVRAMASRMSAGPCVIRLHATGELDPAVGPTLAIRLAALVAAALARCPVMVDLVLTGGETARRVLDAAGITTLYPLDQIEPGSVRSLAPDGRIVVTRPGSIGGPDSLVTITRALDALPTADITAHDHAPTLPTRKALL